MLAKYIHYVATNTAEFIVANLAIFLLAHKWGFHDKWNPMSLEGLI